MIAPTHQSTVEPKTGPHNAQYIARAPLSLQKLTNDPPAGKVLYHTDGRCSSRYKARWASLPHVTRVAPRGGKDPHADQPPIVDAHPATQTVPPRASRSAWARLIAKVYEVDPLICPRCGSEMKLIAVITDPSEVRKVLHHLIKTGRAPPGLDPRTLL